MPERRVREPYATLTIVLAVVILGACGSRDAEEETASGASDTTAAVADAEPLAETGVVDVTAVDYAFRAPAEIPSGWTTFRMANEGEEHHLMILWKVPRGKGVEDYERDVVEPFVIAYDSLMAGAVDLEGMWALFGELAPAWTAQIKPMGGPGFIAPGEVARTTVKLEPGPYVMECYVKNPDGEWHTKLGMLAEMTVTEKSSGAVPPEADLEITLTNAEIETEGPVTAGEHIVAVHFQEQPEVGLGNDVHVVRLDENTSVTEAVEWTHWWLSEGLRAPAPAPFLGGAQEMPAGYTSYFTVNLEPGQYAWFSEGTDLDGLVEEFTVE